MIVAASRFSGEVWSSIREEPSEQLEWTLIVEGLCSATENPVAVGFDIVPFPSPMPYIPHPIVVCKNKIARRETSPNTWKPLPFQESPVMPWTKRPCPLEGAFHTYFSLGDLEGAADSFTEEAEPCRVGRAWRGVAAARLRMSLRRGEHCAEQIQMIFFLICEESSRHSQRHKRRDLNSNLGIVCLRTLLSSVCAVAGRLSCLRPPGTMGSIRHLFTDTRLDCGRAPSRVLLMSEVAFPYVLQGCYFAKALARQQNGINHIL